MKARVEWDGYHWVAVLEGGGVTQAKRLDQIRGRLVEVAKLMTGEVVAPDSIELDVALRADLDEAMFGLRERRRRVEEANRQLVVDTADLVRRLREEAGMSLRDIATLTGVTHQRVDQILKQPVPVSGTFASPSAPR